MKNDISYTVVTDGDRRIFTIDVGNIPASRLKKYIENLKAEFSERRNNEVKDTK